VRADKKADPNALAASLGFTGARRLPISDHVGNKMNRRSN
jgi:hypothetical protein